MLGGLAKGHLTSLPKNKMASTLWEVFWLLCVVVFILKLFGVGVGGLSLDLEYCPL